MGEGSMAKVIDPDGVQWSVSREWFFGLPSWLDGSSDIGLVLFALWPFWLIAHWLGVPWVIVIKRAGTAMGTEEVRGWLKSQRRIQEIGQSAAAGAWRPWARPPAPPTDRGSSTA
ncbi:MAG TPA: hypothetical protein VF477_05525 [Mycobacterium sp.]